MSLMDLLKLNKTVRKYYTPRETTMVCQGCDKVLTRGSAKKCDRCGVMRYCNKVSALPLFSFRFFFLFFFSLEQSTLRLLL